MRKIIIVLTLFLVTACSSVEADYKERFTAGDRDLYITTDKETGCKYIIYEGYKQGGITPLLNSHGTPICKETDQD